jgi:hypothetical protein
MEFLFFCSETVCTGAPSSDVASDGNNEDAALSADPTTNPPSFQCTYGEPRLDEFCSNKASIWKGTAKHDCCWLLLKYECMQDQLELVCEHSQFQTYFQKIKADSDFLRSNHVCLKNVDKTYCKPSAAELNAEPISSWMLTVAGVVVFLMLLCAIALGIKFC